MAKNTLTTAFDQTEKDLKHPIPIRAYKDRIFRMIFKEKRALLALYNAMNDTAYQDPEELVITTLENAIYLGRAPQRPWPWQSAAWRPSRGWFRRPR